MKYTEKPLLSVVVPVYNVEVYLDDAIESIVNQTYKNLEIVLVDDGATDRSPEICDQWADKDYRIKVIHKKNGGLSDARNAGIENSSGAIVTFVDSDDTIEPQMYETLVKLMMQHNADVVCCNYRKMVDGVCSDDENVFHKRSETTIYKEWDALKGLLSWSLNCGAWDKIVRRSVLGGIRFTKGRLNEDVLFWFDVFQGKPTVVECNKAFYNYRVRKGSITRSNHRHADDILKNTEQMTSEVRAKNLPVSDEMRLYSCVSNITYCRYCSKSGYTKGNKNYDEAIRALKSELSFFMFSPIASIRNKVRLLVVLIQYLAK